MAIRIAFIGKNLKAKKFCARYLEKKHGFKWIALEDSVHEVVRKLYYFETRKRVPWETKLKVYDSLYAIDPNIWIGHIEGRLKTTTTNVVIPDARYLNELKVLERLGFTFIRVTAPQTPVKFVKGLQKGTQKGAALYYEWFDRDSEAYVKAEYSINMENNESTRQILDEITKKLFKNLT